MFKDIEFYLSSEKFIFIRRIYIIVVFFVLKTIQYVAKIYLTLFDDPLWKNEMLVAESFLLKIERISDVEYEQVIADRYLFSTYSNESSWWPCIKTFNVRSAWEVVLLPEYHSQSSEGVWLLIEREEINELLEICYMLLSGSGSLIVLLNVNVNSNGSFLASFHNKDRIKYYTPVLISANHVKLDITSCVIKRTIPFPSSLIERTRKIAFDLFIPDLNSMRYLYVGSDSGLNLQTFEIIPYINGLNVSVGSLAWSWKH
jgi:hypothetical protein